MSEKPSVKLPAVVEKIIRSPLGGPEKAQIAIEGGDHLYKELRIPNALKDNDGEVVHLKPGATVVVSVEAKPQPV